MKEALEELTGWPGWLQEFDHALSFQPQFVLAGNIRDLHSVPTSDGLIHLQTTDAIWALLQHRGLEYLLSYDPVDSIQVLAPRARESWPTSGPFERLQKHSGSDIAFSDLGHFVRAVQPATGVATPAGALIIDYASRIGSPLAGSTPEHDHLFVTSEKTSHRARPRGSAGLLPPYNPIIWLANQANDIPDWFRIGNEAVRTIVIGLPDRAERQKIVDRAGPSFFDYGELAEDERAKLMLQFVLLTEGMTIRAMYAVQELARTRRFGLSRIADAVRAYRIGSSEDPWKEDSVRTSIRTAEEEIGKAVKGQRQAILQTADILKRAVTGLTGAHAGRSGNRPRGVLFLAGPTGVGKTELAKQVTKILFGDEGAYHRFDMSEFSSEHSEARLIGAPPGYVGHDAGGELVNAIRRRPFSVVLFDEIEKAHPRILDKFLQILEDGRLTDGRGDTVYFSEAVIIFTSNLGIYGEELQGDRYVRVPKVTPETAANQAEVEAIVKPEIEKHFRFELKRPELLNRIGDNIVVFDFIREDVSLEILDKMIDNVVQRVAEESGHALTFGEAAIAELQQQAISAAAEYGGRGIGNRLETCLVNPLARALFDTPPAAASRTIRVELIERTELGWAVALK